MKPVLCIHGGLNDKKGLLEKGEQYARSIKKIAEAGYKFLQKHNAVETAIFVTKLLEDDPLFNAGTGSVIQSDGVIRMSASLMDGRTQIFSGVMNIEKIKNPVEVAAELQKENDRVLAGDQAQKYARNMGLKNYNPETAERRKDFELKRNQIFKKKNKPTSTVGCVVLDSKGNLAAATSTGGKGWEIPGRVGDSPTIAGNYANKYAAVSATGCGEDIVSSGLANALVTRVSDGMKIKMASSKAIKELNAIKGQAGFIALTNKGEIVAGATPPYLVWAKVDKNGLIIFNQKNDIFLPNP